MKAVAFIHTYAQDREHGSFMLELMQGFKTVGIELHVIKVNDLVENLSKNTYKSNIDEKKLIKTIQTINPSFIFSSNHGGIGKAIKKNFKHLPIITWMVDRNPFLHHGGSIDTLFGVNDHVITSSTANVKKLEIRFPTLVGRVHYLPFMTNPDSFNHDVSKEYNISFVGSVFVNASVLIKMIQNNLKNKELLNNLFAFIEEVKQNYDLDLKDRIGYFKLDRLIKDNNLTQDKFLGIIANMISNNKRFEYLGAIADLGLVLFGTRNWYTALKSSIDVVKSFQFGEFIKTREQLCSVYDRSKISININHHQATTGVGYRVFDIMASSSLLISNYQEKSDLEIMFGKEHPIPIYKSAKELRHLVQHYLEHEDERLEIVKQCNQLIADEHTFKRRAIQIAQIADPNFIGMENGRIIHYEYGYFENGATEINTLKLTPRQKKWRKFKKNPRQFINDIKWVRRLGINL